MRHTGILMDCEKARQQEDTKDSSPFQRTQISVYSREDEACGNDQMRFNLYTQDRFALKNRNFSLINTARVRKVKLLRYF